MQFRPWALGAVAALVAVSAVSAATGFAGDATKGAHPHFNDGGTLAWSTKLADAQTAAKAQDRLIFIEYGRKACGNCKAVCEGVLTDPKVKDRLSKLAVGLAAECDPPNREDAVGKLLSANLAGANTLPFCGFVTQDLQWIAGFSGYKDAAAFDAVLTQAENSPLLQAKPDVAKKLEVIAQAAEQAAEKGVWAKTLAAAKSAAELKGKCPARDRIAAAVAKGRAWAEDEISKALSSAVGAADRTAQRVALKRVSAAFAGEPEAKDADTGVKALERVGVIESLPDDKQGAAKEKAAKDFAGTRWVGLFDGSAAKPAETPAGEGEPAK